MLTPAERLALLTALHPEESRMEPTITVGDQTGGVFLDENDVAYVHIEGEDTVALTLRLPTRTAFNVMAFLAALYEPEDAIDVFDAFDEWLSTKADEAGIEIPD